MRRSKCYNFYIFIAFFVGLSFTVSSRDARAKALPLPDIKGQFKKSALKQTSPLELQADQLSFSNADNKAHAKGNVVVTSQDQQLFSDELQIDRVIQEAVAQGNVYLDTPNEQVMGDGLTYNFNTHTGEFRDAKVFMDIYQVSGKKISKLDENHMRLEEGYMTTCDLDEPHYRIGARRMDIYPKEKAVIHGMKIYLGKVPIMYVPYYVQDLSQKPILSITPGQSKDFGLFLLTAARFKVNPEVKMTVHFDSRERVGFGQGADIKYNTPNFGAGLLSVYYTNENKIASSHFWNLYQNGVKKGPTTHNVLYRIMWRHHWEIDKNTDAVMQFYKIHDYDIVNNGFLKRYFPREYRQDSQNTNLDTYFLLTRVMPFGTLLFNVDTNRVNPALRGIERLPEVSYIINSQQIGQSGFYFKSSNVLSNLHNQNYPKTYNFKTLRFDTNNDISHPLKIGFIEFNPHLGGENTYYSRTADPNRTDIIRGMFRGSLDMSTKFYRFWDYHTHIAGLNINGLRHVITPTITYLYQAKPTFPASRLNQYDSAIDNLYRIHEFQFGLENKLQTKRNGQIVDLLRALVTSNFGLKGTTGHRGFNPYEGIIDFNPTDWLTFHSDNEYDEHAGHINYHNIDGTIHQGNWSFGLGNRYTRNQGDQITTELKFRLNPKWSFRIYNSYPLIKADNGAVSSVSQNEYVITRDLHEWEMDLSMDQQKGHGTTFFILMRLKAFPDTKLNLVSTSFQPSSPGSQN